MVRTESRTYETKVGDLVTVNVLILSATVLSIPAVTRSNSNGTEWRLAQAEIVYPNGLVKTVQAQLFEKSYQMYPDSFTVGAAVELVVQTEGEAKGMAKMQLPTLDRIDVTAFMEEDFLTTVNEEKVANHLVNKELVQ
ncbi:hypothetical protein NO995_06330 [Aestuariibaculum sp. M13]|uniref:hypothetical protein n=1 Tax=Aestuariibaculum sp. M13 TaxID=2967132 RepID=UPI002159D631|nr:hypothetical protein [Aestuariibaculum sp. M13]MCR8667289.1 hypothetical protein [Aestuariibaculum sp. M13]